MELGIYN